jgi:sterol desaturase/sphingolipid hydroxylase (fatty acid hydroxylase superfamily)
VTSLYALLDHTWALLLAAAASFALLAAVFVPLERAFPARPGQRVLRRDLLVDACFFLGQYLLFSGVALSLLAFVAPHLRVGAPLAALHVHPIAQGAVALLLGDVVMYWWHRACHAVPFLWRFHSVHHSATELDWLAAHREHPLDGLTTQLAVNLPGIVLGVPLEILGPVAVFRGMWAIFIHSNVRLTFLPAPVRVLLGAPELHHWHHARDVVTTKNFANLAPWVDVLFGTYERPHDDGTERYPLGLTTPWPRRYLAQLARPFMPDRK